MSSINVLLAGFVIPIRDIRASVGAGFLFPLVGEVSKQTIMLCVVNSQESHCS